MRKNAKQMTALALALGMTAGGMGNFQALASAPPTETKVDTLTNGKGNMSMDVEGVIKATQVKVTVPLKAAFDIDPGKCSTALEDDANGKVGDGVVNQAESYKITNGSVMPVWVYISGIKAKTNADDNAFTDIELVSTKAALEGYTAGDNNKVMIAIKDKAKTAIADKKIEGSEETFWLSPTKQTGLDGATNYYLDDNGDGTTSGGELAANGGTLELKVYALTKGTWSDGMKFAVTPTFTVSATKPTL